MSYTHVSQDPENFQAVFLRQVSLADDIRGGKVEVDQGAAEAKALFGATKTLEIDLHARVFAHRVGSQRPALPAAGERSGGELAAPAEDQ